jgi:hypothetical protein
MPGVETNDGALPACSITKEADLTYNRRRDGMVARIYFIIRVVTFCIVYATYNLVILGR